MGNLREILEHSVDIRVGRNPNFSADLASSGISGNGEIVKWSYTLYDMTPPSTIKNGELQQSLDSPTVVYTAALAEERRQRIKEYIVAAPAVLLFTSAVLFSIGGWIYEKLNDQNPPVISPQLLAAPAENTPLYTSPTPPVP